MVLSISGFIVLLITLFFLYKFIMKLLDLDKEEIGEKLEEIKKTDQLHKTIKKVDVNKVKKEKENIKNFKNI